MFPIMKVRFESSELYFRHVFRSTMPLEEYEVPAGMFCETNVDAAMLEIDEGSRIFYQLNGTSFEIDIRRNLDKMIKLFKKDHFPFYQLYEMSFVTQLYLHSFILSEEEKKERVKIIDNALSDLFTAELRKCLTEYYLIYAFTVPTITLRSIIKAQLAFYLQAKTKEISLNASGVQFVPSKIVSNFMQPGSDNLAKILGQIDCQDGNLFGQEVKHRDEIFARQFDKIQMDKRKKQIIQRDISAVTDYLTSNEVSALFESVPLMNWNNYDAIRPLAPSVNIFQKSAIQTARDSLKKYDALLKMLSDKNGDYYQIAQDAHDGYWNGYRQRNCEELELSRNVVRRNILGGKIAQNNQRLLTRIDASERKSEQQITKKAIAYLSESKLNPTNKTKSENLDNKDAPGLRALNIVTNEKIHDLVKKKRPAKKRKSDVKKTIGKKEGNAGIDDKIELQAIVDFVRFCKPKLTTLKKRCLEALSCFTLSKNTVLKVRTLASELGELFEKIEALNIEQQGKNSITYDQLQAFNNEFENVTNKARQQLNSVLKNNKKIQKLQMAARSKATLLRQFDKQIKNAIKSAVLRQAQNKGGTIKLSVPNDMWYDISERYHNRYLKYSGTAFFGDVERCLRPDESFALYITESSSTHGISFCVSIHLWKMRPGTFNDNVNASLQNDDQPEIKEDAKSDLIAPIISGSTKMNRLYWRDTDKYLGNSFLVLHVPGAT